MKRNLLWLFFFFIPMGYTQIILFKDDLPKAGNTYIRVITNPGSITLTPPGANQTWDYRNLMELGRDTITFVSVSQTPLAYQYFFNNPILYPDYYAAFAKQAESFNLFNQISITDRYIYYKLDTAYKIVGFGANVNGVPTSVKYDDIEELLPLPLQFGQQRHYTGAYMITIPQMGTYGQMIEKTVQVDASGILMLPSGSYSTLRTVTTLQVTDTVFYSASGFGIKVPRPSQTLYQWWGKNQGIPLLELIITDSIPTQAYYKISEISALDPLVKQSFQTLINLSQKKIIFLVPLEKRPFTTIELYTVDGKLLKESPYQEEWILDTLPSGFYFVKMQVGEKVLVEPLCLPY